MEEEKEEFEEKEDGTPKEVTTSSMIDSLKGKNEMNLTYNSFS